MIKKQRLKITQLEKVRLTKVNELKLIQVELFSLFYFMSAVANASELLCMPYLENIECFLYNSNLSFKISNFTYP